MSPFGVESWDPTRFGSFDVVCYHANCTDGIAAAAVVYQLHLAGGASQPEFLPVHYNQPLPDRVLAGGSRLLFVDFCPEREQIQEVQARWEDWFVIDHHQSREWILREYPHHAFFDLERSGAMLAWHWFRQDYMPPNPPEILGYVQDRDLWQWKLPDSREVSAALGEEPKEVAHWAQQVMLWGAQSTFVPAGRILLKARTRHASSLADKCFSVSADPGDFFYAVNATEHVSEVCEEILGKFLECDIACAYFYVGPHQVQLSFRSRAHWPGPCNALQVAQFFGGGGHPHSAGAMMSAKSWADYLEGMAHERLSFEQARRVIDTKFANRQNERTPVNG